MLAKYNVEYGAPFRRGVVESEYNTDDPVDCEEFLAELLERGFRIKGIKHEGVALSSHEFEKMIKAAANMLVARHICNSLEMKTEEERFRFGFAA